LDALRQSVYVPVVPTAGVPESTPELKVTLEGSVEGVHPANPAFVIVGTGYPVATVVNVPKDPTENVVDEALVIAGDWSTVSVNDCVAFVPIPFEAVIVIG
jgi:hypothetical protein